MKSPFYFIVESLINKRYNNTKSISGLDVIISTSEEDYISSNRLAKVIEVPLGYSGPITPGDILLVHHNVFKFYYDMRGKQKSGKSFFKDNRMIDEQTGKVQTFNSMVDALNYMGNDGWEFVQAYIVTVGQSNVYHWLLKKQKE